MFSLTKQTQSNMLPYNVAKAGVVTLAGDCTSLSGAREAVMTI